MKKYIGILKNTKLFRGMGEQDIETMLGCLGATIGQFSKGEYVFRAGEHITQIVIVLEGEMHIQQDDYWGNRTIVSRIAEGEMFGEAYVAPDNGTMLNDAAVIKDCVLMFIDVQRILTVCSSACKFHSLTVKNLFYAISNKNRMLISKIGYISKRTTREKLLSYLSDEAKAHGSSSFDIPFNRQQLADFLSVDRSAMSNELCKMRDEGLLEFNKSFFKLL